MDFLFENTAELLPMYSAALPFLGFALIVGYAIARTGQRGRAHISTYIWAAVFAGLELFLTIWCTQLLVETTWLVLGIYSAALALMGILVFLREPMMNWQERLATPKSAEERARHGGDGLSWEERQAQQRAEAAERKRREKLARQTTDPMQTNAVVQQAQATQVHAAQVGTGPTLVGGAQWAQQQGAQQQGAQGAEGEAAFEEPLGAHAKTGQHASAGRHAKPGSRPSVSEKQGKSSARRERPEGTFPRSLGVTALTIVRDVVLLAFVTMLAQNALEVADNPLWREIPEEYMHFDYLIIMLALGALYFLGQRRGALPAGGVVVLALFGIAESFLDRFKNTAILPSDLTALGTAAAVAGGYTYILNTTCLWSIIFGCIALFMLAFITPPKGRKVPAPARVVANVALAAALAFSLGNIYNSQDLQKRFDFKLWYWDLRVNYSERSTIVAFLAAAQDLKINEPEGYSPESAQALQNELDAAYDAGQGATEAQQQANAQFEQTKPNVIAIMNESYADLSIFDELHAGYTGTPYLTGATEGMVQRGWATVSVHGGNTCNSEFEFITGISMGFIGYAKYPYLQYDFVDENTMAKQFKELGYETTAIHPNYPGNWNRETIYRNMGFDSAYFIYDFGENPPEFHSGITDAATYERALESITSSDQPQFVFDVTMQNHGGYDRGNIPTGELTSYTPDFGDAESTVKLNEYLSCVARSDADLKAFLEQLAALDEPVAVVFFGDHQPNLTRDINDTLYSGEPELVHASRIEKTPYFIWTNYEVAGAGAWNGTDVNLSTNYLSAAFMQRIGAPLSGFQKAQLELESELPLVNANGVYVAGDTWYSYSDVVGEAAQAVNQLNTIQYLNFAP